MENRASRVGVTLSQTRQTDDQSFDKITAFYERDIDPSEEPRRALENVRTVVGQFLAGNFELNKPDPSIPLKIRATVKQLLNLKDEEVEKLIITDQGTYWRLKLIYIDDKDLIGTFAHRMREKLGAEYVSDKAKKEYYFKIPK